MLGYKYMFIMLQPHYLTARNGNSNLRSDNYYFIVQGQLTNDIFLASLGKDLIISIEQEPNYHCFQSSCTVYNQVYCKYQLDGICFFQLEVKLSFHHSKKMITYSRTSVLVETSNADSIMRCLATVLLLYNNQQVSMTEAGEYVGPPCHFILASSTQICIRLSSFGLKHSCRD